MEHNTNKNKQVEEEGGENPTDPSRKDTQYFPG